jgi:hypothetical protein
MSVFALSDLLTDILRGMLTCLRIAATQHARLLPVAIGFGLLLAAACWIGTSRFARLWNRRFQVTAGHQVVCGIAASAAFLATLGFFGMQFVSDYAQLRVGMWEAELLVDVNWQRRTFTKAYEDVRALGTEDFRGSSPTSGSIPAETVRARQVIARRYVTEAVADFRARSPWLGSVLRPAAAATSERLRMDMDAMIAAPSNAAYPLDPATGFVARGIAESLLHQTPRLTTLGRTVVVAAFCSVELVALGVIGYAAHREIRLFL